MASFPVSACKLLFTAFSATVTLLRREMRTASSPRAMKGGDTNQSQRWYYTMMKRLCRFASRRCHRAFDDDMVFAHAVSSTHAFYHRESVSFPFSFCFAFLIVPSPVCSCNREALRSYWISVLRITHSSLLLKNYSPEIFKIMNGNSDIYFELATKAVETDHACN
ncbi:hypothetical protein E2542_SST29496 [Spatholobus suberectus]|nr:hypothetical protein E2542_SST29496 [Spatholobus suberectus]